MKKSLDRRRVTDYTSADLLRQWDQMYQKTFGRQPQGLPARDLKMIKALLDSGYTPSQIILGMEGSIIHTTAPSIPRFIEQIEEEELIAEPFASWYVQLRDKDSQEGWNLYYTYQMMDTFPPGNRNEEGMAEIAAKLDGLLNE